MNKKNKLRKILGVLSPDGTQVDFADFDSQVSSLKEKLKEKITVKTLVDVQAQLEKFKAKLDLKPLTAAVDKIRASFDEESQRLSDEIEQKTAELMSANKIRVNDLNTEISDLKLELSTLEETRKKDIENILKNIPTLNDIEDRLGEFVTEISARLDILEEPEEEQEVEDWQKKLDSLRIELMGLVSNVGGGSMNRKITVGNTDPLTKYTDINLKAGSNVTITTANNEVTKRVDITISSSGGGGSVIGTTRSISTLTVSSTIGTNSGVDQVYLVNGGLQITLPDATNDTNLYTIKNIGTSSVLVNTQLGQTIDNDSTIIMPVRYTSVDIISDSANWNVT